MPIFLNPWLLLGLAALPAIWWLLRAIPPQPRRIDFPATRILKGLTSTQESPSHTPWWLTAIRMLAATLVILAFAEPVLNPQRALLTATGPLVLAIDNGWAAASHWGLRLDEAKRLIDEADGAGQSILIAPTARDARAVPLHLMSPREARDALAALAPEPFASARAEAATGIGKAMASKGDANVFWLSDGIAGTNGPAFAGRLATIAGATGHLTILSPGPDGQALGLTSKLGAGGALEFAVVRAGGAPSTVTVEALSSANQPLSEATINLPPESGSADQRIEVPLELRNQISRLAIRGEPSAGAVQLLDSASRWNRIGLVTGAARESLQPLLGHLYYVERALKPYAELAIPQDNDTDTAIGKLIAANVSMLVLADVGKVVGPAKEMLGKFLNRGGVLVRFAGPRLEEAGDDLLPVDLRTGGRSLGGALSWSTPQPLGAFEADSPFAGLTIPDDVRVSRQVLADPALLADRTRIWARLGDGTPLVTAEKRSGGWIVLFHVTANSDWSNLPLSGLFVDMLRRITRLTGRTELAGAGRESAGAAAPANGLLPPLASLDAYGALAAPPPTAEPLAKDTPASFVPDASHPPGLYGAEGTSRALNVLSTGAVLAPISDLPTGVSSLIYRGVDATPLKPLALAMVLGLLLVDMLAVLWLQSGALGGRLAGRAAVPMLLVAASLLAATVILPSPASAANADADAFALKASLSTHLAYVVTGDLLTDDTSRQGLAGLGQVLLQRTAVEPGEPVGVNIEKDDLTFFPVLYWPVNRDAPELSEPARARVTAYMKGGGLIVFDTREEADKLPALDASNGNAAFQRLAAHLDIPRLEQVPAGHVLTKSFYLLKGFPGRYDSGPMWVEAGGGAPGDMGNGTADAPVASQSDGVSSVIVTGNDLAGAWASDDNGNGLYAVVPGGEEQREMAYRVGVNIVMYALTGNYKADQVHVTTILERLGQ